MSEVLRWLRRAHAGELGAALAYRGHARSVRDAGERARILRILGEELAHRAEAAALLTARGATGDRQLARWVARLGRIAGIACRCTGHWAPMLGAAIAEAINVGEYRRLGAAARAAGDGEALDFARRSQRLEAEHARWFAACAERHGGVGAAIAQWSIRDLADPAVPVRLAATPVAVGR